MTINKHVFLGSVLASTLIVAVSSAQTTDRSEASQPGPITSPSAQLKSNGPTCPLGWSGGQSVSIETRSPSHYALVQDDSMKTAVPSTLRLGCSERDTATGSWYPTDLNIAVLNGSFGLGIRDSFDAPALHNLLLAGNDRRQPLSQTSGSRVNRRQGTIVAVAAAAGFGVGYATYYFQNKPLDHPDERAHAMAAGTFSAFIAGAIAWVVVVGP